MTVGDLRRLIADIPDDVPVRVLVPAGKSSLPAKGSIIGFGETSWKPGRKARSLLICRDADLRDTDAEVGIREDGVAPP